MKERSNHSSKEETHHKQVCSFKTIACICDILPGQQSSSKNGYKSFTAHSTDQQPFLAIAQQLLGLVQVAVTCSYSNVATGMRRVSNVERRRAFRRLMIQVKGNIARYIQPATLAAPKRTSPMEANPTQTAATFS
jgi:hypothetical protein